MSTSEQRPPELTELERATESLVDQVASLSDALQSIGALQEQQLELQRQVTLVKEDVQENAVPKHEFEKAQADVIKGRQRLQTRIRVFAISMACLALVVSCATGWFSYWASQRATDRAIEGEHKARLAVCQQRNADTLAGSARSKVFFAPYLAKEAHNPHADPVLVAILRAIAETPPQLLKCR